MTASKACHECREYRRERAGPHEWIAYCGLQQIDFLHAEHCAFYHPRSSLLEDEGERWPYLEHAR